MPTKQQGAALMLAYQNSERFDQTVEVISKFGSQSNSEADRNSTPALNFGDANL